MRRRTKREIRSEYPLAESLGRKRVFNGRGFFYDTKTRRKIDPTLSDDTIRAALVFAEDLAKKSGHVLKLNAPEKKLLDSTFESAEEAGSKKNLPVTKKSP